MIKQAADKKFRFIPYRKRDIVEMCLQDNRVPGQEENFRYLYRLLDNIFHYEFHRLVESMKDAYAPLDPDSDTRPCENIECSTQRSFVELLCGLLEKANYERVTQADLIQALRESSLFRIRLHVDFDDFEEVQLFYRGVSTRHETISTWMGLVNKTIEFINYDRVVVYIRFREYREGPQAEFPSCRPGSTLLKLFRNVPKADIEMLFPNTSVRMRAVDKLLIGIPALVSGGIVITTKLGASLLILGSLLGFWLGLRSQPVELNKTALIVVFAGLVALGGYLWKQFSNFKNRKLRFMQTLIQNLYFKNLDNNAGVFHHIANDAEEEECKEAILAYYFLLTSERPLSRTELDRRVENWLAAKWNCSVDFEIDDALRKLLALELVRDTNGGLTAIPIEAGIQKLDQRWDAFFSPSST